MDNDTACAHPLYTGSSCYWELALSAGVNCGLGRQSATRLLISIPKAGIKSTVLLHEISHSMTSDAMGEQSHHHGPRFVGVFMRLLCDHIPTFSLDALAAAAKNEAVDFNFDGPIHN
jgi:hypothetical protein